MAVSFRKLQGTVLCILLAGCQNSSLLTSGLVAQINALREEGGRCGGQFFDSAPSVRSHSDLAQAAQGHAEAMEAEGFFGHTGLDGSTVGSRVTATGYRWTLVAENIALGQTTPEQALQSWMESEGHCTNLRNPRVEEIGLGNSGSYWVLVLARPSD